MTPADVMESLELCQDTIRALEAYLRLHPDHPMMRERLHALHERRDRLWDEARNGGMLPETLRAQRLEIRAGLDDADKV